jgi:class 3 adenylate cyclase
VTVHRLAQNRRRSQRASRCGSVPSESSNAHQASSAASRNPSVGMFVEFLEGGSASVLPANVSATDTPSPAGQPCLTSPPTSTRTSTTTSPSAMTDQVAPSSDGSTHGFLFADLRGYTHLVDTRGAVEATRLLGRYRAIVREVVAHHGGAEIKTEGDSFYVVLPSASTALRCGLDIRKSCTEPSDGGEAIQLGIGIHAGESVAHEGGFVGSAINIAARICALATAGEVLVTGTIRELTRSIVPARFVFVGRRHLKGLDQPVEVFSVVPDGAVSPVRRRSLGVAAGHPVGCSRFSWSSSRGLAPGAHTRLAGARSRGSRVPAVPGLRRPQRDSPPASWPPRRRASRSCQISAHATLRLGCTAQGRSTRERMHRCAIGTRLRSQSRSAAGC